MFDISPVHLIVFAAIAFFAIVIGALVVEQVRSISHDFPSYVDTGTKYINRHFHVDITQQSDKIKSIGISSLPGLAGSALNIFTTVVGVVKVVPDSTASLLVIDLRI